MSRLKILSRKQVFAHPWESIFIERVQTKGGKEFDYLISEPNEFVVVVPIIDQSGVLLVKQYKHGAEKNLLGFPAGFLHTGESPEDCARRELLEETGYTASSFRQVAKLFENPTRCRNSYYIIMAEGAKQPKEEVPNNVDELEGTVTPQVYRLDQFRDPKFLQRMEAGPMLSAVPFLLNREEQL